MFYCGSLERIGIRHRASQTLFLSELIDPTNCRDPSYGALHTALHLAIFRDAAERDLLLTEAEKTISRAAGKKRRRSTDDVRTIKRRLIMTRSVGRDMPQAMTTDIMRESPTNVSILCCLFFCRIKSDSGKQVVLGLCSERNLLLIEFHHTVYSSQAPAMFSRELPSLLPGKIVPDVPPQELPHRKRTYAPHQYCKITITSDLGDGAIGVVHGGRLEAITHEGVSYSCEAVIKLAFTEKAQESMRYEYGIYKHLVASNTVGISTVFGMFRDMDADGPLALVMSFGGVNIWDSRRSSTNPDDVDIPQAER